MDSRAPSAAQPATDSPLGLSKRKTRRRLSTYKVAHFLHSLVGLKLSLLFSIVLVTGTIAVFSEEIDWLLYSEVRVTPQETRMNPGAVFDQVQASMPEVGLASYFTANDRERTASQMLMTLPSGGFKKVWADPYTGEVNGITNFLTVGEFFSILHRNLFMPLIGRALVNVFGVFCIIGLISGLILYRNFWRKFFVLPRLNAGLRIFLSDVHKFVGLWSLWFILIIGVSGSWWFYNNPLVVYKVAPNILPAQGIDPQLSYEDLNALGTQIPTPLSASAIVDAVNAHDPDFTVHMLTPPEHNGMAYSVRGTRHDLLTSKWDSVYFLNPFTGEVIGSKLAEDLPPIVRFDRAMVPLHYGTFGYEGAADMSVKALWFVFGLGMSFLSISGMIIYYQRTKAATRKLLPETGAARKAKQAWLIFRPWGGPMSVMKYLNWAFIVVIFIGIGIGFKLQSEGTSGSGYRYVEQPIGDWVISMNATRGLLEKDMDPIQAGRGTNFNIYSQEGNAKAIKFMYVNLRKPRSIRAPGSVVHGAVGNQHAHVRVPAQLPEDGDIWLTIEDWQGNIYQRSWPLMPDGKLTIDTRQR